MNSTVLHNWAETTFGYCKYNSSANELAVQSCFAVDHKAHLIINVKKRVYNCWLSGQGGHLTSLLKQMHGTAWRDVAISVFQYNQMDFSVYKNKEEFSAELIDLDLVSIFEDDYFGEMALKYLNSRHLIPENLKPYNPKVIPDYDAEWSGRLIFPLIDQHKIPVNYIGRDMFGRKPKYMFPDADSTITTKSSLTFRSKMQNDRYPEYSDYLFVVEGLFDVFGLDRFGLDSVAVFGKSPSRTQLIQIAQSGKKLVFLLDSGEEELSVRAANFLLSESYSEKIYLASLERGDPGDLQSIKMLRTAMNGITRLTHLYAERSALLSSMSGFLK